MKIGAATGAAWVMGTECLAADTSDVKARPIENVRVGMVGIGNRGTFLLRLLLEQEGVKVKAVCDLIPQRVAKAQDMVTAAKQPKPTGYSRGETDFKRLCETEELDLVVNATRPWKWHVPISVAAMTTGKHAATEVPAAETIEGCWELVEATEKTQKYCVMLENCCYFREVMLVHNMLRKGLFGELRHCEVGYQWAQICGLDDEAYFRVRLPKGETFHLPVQFVETCNYTLFLDPEDCQVYMEVTI